MLSLFISSIVFLIAAWYINRYLDGIEIPKGMARSMVVFMLASIVAWGSSILVDWVQGEPDVSQNGAPSVTDLNQLLNAAGQQKR